MTCSKSKTLLHYSSTTFPPLKDLPTWFYSIINHHMAILKAFVCHQLLSCWFFSKACGNKVDPVYEALRFGTSLAQKAKRASGSESPHGNSVRKGSFIMSGSVCFYSVNTKYQTLINIVLTKFYLSYFTSQVFSSLNCNVHAGT